MIWVVLAHEAQVIMCGPFNYKLKKALSSRTAPFSFPFFQVISTDFSDTREQI